MHGANPTFGSNAIPQMFGTGHPYPNFDPNSEWNRQQFLAGHPMTDQLQPEFMAPPYMQLPPYNSQLQTQQHMMHLQGAPMPLQVDSSQCNDSSSQPGHSGNGVDPCAQVVQTLLCYHQGGEDPEFVRKAIDSLVRKLKDKRTELDALIMAVTSSGKQQTGCVTIQRSLDGRLQVAGRKGVPHVVYARIWRWPNVSKNELQKLPACQVPSDHPDLICINPFHYERVVSSGVGNIDMSSLNLDPLPSASFAPNNTYDNYGSSYKPYNQLGAVELGESSQETKSGGTLLMYGPHQQPSCVVSHLPSGETHFNQANPNFGGDQTYWTNPGVNNGMIDPTALCTGNKAQNVFGVQRYENLRGNLHCVKIPQTPCSENWCSITYYELDTQVGETFKVPWDQSEVLIDGGMDPAGTRSGRICLGALSNVHRSEASERARMCIGKGIRLRHTPDGSVVLDCLSSKGIFVRSYFLDFELGLIYGSTVHKFCTGAEKKLFDLRWAYAEMCEQRKTTQMAATAQAYAVAGLLSSVAPSVIERAGTGVDDLRRVCCTIAISFVKGWGTGYNRTSIKETPCWIEIQLHRPLQLLNLLLQKSS